MAEQRTARDARAGRGRNGADVTPIAGVTGASRDRGGGAFWQEKSLEELAEEQHVRPITRLEEVLGKGADLWESDEDFESFLQDIMAHRRDGELS